MTTIWRRSEAGYERLEPAGFPSEAELHELVSAAPELLPLAGSPDLVTLGDEVALGNGYADVLALERGGRLVLIEVKLAGNSEARRAVVAQLLSYASFLRGNTVVGLERGALASQLAQRGAADIASLAAAGFQDTTLGDGFRAAMQDSLDTGSFRLVWVLDDAPPELVSLVGYLEYISSGIVTIDLVTVKQYEVGGERVIVPQRVEPARVEPREDDAGGPDGRTPVTTQGADDFLDSIEVAPESERPLLRKLAEWAITLEQEGLARLWTTSGVSGRKVLKPCVPGEDVGFVTVWNEAGRPSLTLWRTVFERCAPGAIERVETAIGAELGTGRSVPDVTDAVLDALTGAYREAAEGADDAD
jgi:hypothetical protein